MGNHDAPARPWTLHYELKQGQHGLLAVAPGKRPELYKGLLGALYWKRRKGTIHITSVWVDSAWRRKGIASALVDEMARREKLLQSDVQFHVGDLTAAGEAWWDSYSAERGLDWQVGFHSGGTDQSAG